MRKQAQGNQGTFPRSHIEWFYLEGTILKEKKKKKELKENKWACDFKWGLFKKIILQNTGLLGWGAGTSGFLTNGNGKVWRTTMIKWKWNRSHSSYLIRRLSNPHCSLCWPCVWKTWASGFLFWEKTHDMPRALDQLMGLPGFGLRFDSWDWERRGCRGAGGRGLWGCKCSRLWATATWA